MCEKINIRLYCCTCDNIDCQFSNKLGYIFDTTKQGCSRELLLDDFSKYEHYKNEIIPFWRIINNQSLVNEQYNEIITFLNNKIYQQNIKNFYDDKGKVVSLKEILND